MLKRLFTSSVLVMLLMQTAIAGDKIKYYFNHAVDTTVATDSKAIYLHNCLADTFVAYINRAKYTIDVAQYDYNQGNFANIATAMNAAYTRGVKIRWIYDGSSSNTGLDLLDTNIHTLGSPTNGNYGIMHNKFVVIDLNSPDSTDAIVWTGSPDWSTEQFNTDYNNAIIFQSAVLANAYTLEFNMMWGGTGLTPNHMLSKFGPHKTDLGLHNFVIDGTPVELYFSPSDYTNTHIQGAISSAHTDLYVGMYTFTDNSDAQLIAQMHTTGVYAAVIEDVFSESYSPHSTLTNALGSNFITYNGTGIYHNKFMIIDPSDTCSDPLVLTGSHNWSIAANTQNDENTVIVHNKTAANVYYQSFKADFNAMGGTLQRATDTTCNPLPTTGISTPVSNGITVYPNPSNQAFTIAYNLSIPANVTISIVNEVGQNMITPVNKWTNEGAYKVSFAPQVPGVYFLTMKCGTDFYTSKLIKL